MKLTKRAVALLLTVMLVLTALPLGIFATETTSASALTYRISFKVKGQTSSRGATKIEYGIMAQSGDSFYYKDGTVFPNYKTKSSGDIYGSGNLVENITMNEWTTVSLDVPITEDMTTTQLLLTIELAGSSGSVYYFDDISVVELMDEKEPVALILSREEAGSIYDTLSCFSRSSINEPIVDTYVSRTNPDTVYGTEGTLLLGDVDGDKKLMVLSFASCALENDDHVLLNMPNSGAALENVSVFWVDNYLLDETALTYKTMPAYESNLLGTYDFVSGINKLDLSSIRDQLTGDFFTLVFRTDAHSFKQDFESYSSTQTFSNDAANNQLVNGTWYYYDYPAAGAEASQSLARRGGNLGGIKIATESDGNQVLSVSTSKTAKGVGRLKFFNSLTGAEVGKTYRFTATVKLASVSSNAHVTASVMLSVGTSAITDVNDVKVETTKTEMSNAGDTVTLTLDYTVRAEDLPADTTATINSVSTPVKAYPMFTIEFGDGSSSVAEQNTYYVDNLSVVEVDHGEPATFASREAESGDSVKFVSGVNNVVTAEVSNTTTDTVFTADENDLLSVVEGKLVFTSKDGKKYNLCKYDGTKYDLTTLSEGESLTVAAIYDGETVRFAVGNNLACYGKEKITYGLPYSGEIACAIDGATESEAYEEDPELVGFQYSLVDDSSVRFLAGIDSLYYTSIGFRVERDGEALVQESSSPYVFNSVKIGSEEVTVKGCNYLTALIINGIDSDGVITVTPYVTVGEGVVIYGAPQTYTITVTVESGLTITLND